MTLHADRIGQFDGSRPTVVLVHGFTQNRRCWGPLLDLLAAEVDLVVVDAPGHGLSGHDDADLWEAGRLAVEVAGPAVLVGYSMGGRIVLHAALQHHDAVRGAVLIGATGGIDDDDERSDRRHHDEELAQSLLTIGLPDFLDGWLANPLFAGLTPEAAARPARLENRPEGLAASLRNCGTGRQEPLWDRLDLLHPPVLAVAGADDTKFTELGQRLVDSIGQNAELVLIDGGHAVHLEQPQAVADVVVDFARSNG